MKIKQRFEISPLPDDATFLIDGDLGKIENDLLYIWNRRTLVWICKGKSLAEFNNFWSLEYHEYSLGQIVYAELIHSNGYKHGFKTFGYYGSVEYCVFRDWDDNYKISLFKAVKKGFKGERGKYRYSGGPCVVIRSELYPQLEELVGDNRIMVPPIDTGFRKEYTG